MTEPGGSVGRLLADITVGTIQSTRRRDLEVRENALKEIELQYQFQINGVAAPELAFAPITVTFTHSFFYAPGERLSSLEYPQFSFGAHTTPAVGIHAVVESWYHDTTNGAINGALVQVGAIGNAAFDGLVHLTFQGYAALSEDQSVESLAGG